jgi:Na+/H+ antiporter
MAVVQIILIALVAVIALATLAQRLTIPYPILLVLGGVALGFAPGLPSVSFDPGLIFVLFVPPLVYYAAWNTSWREFQANLGAIGLLATGLVVATIGVVAVVGHALVPGLTWPAALVLGTIVSSTDAVAATAIAERLHLPRRLVTILEGESMANDPASLVAYRFAVMAVVTGTFSLGQVGVQLVLAVIGGVVVGLAVAWLADQVQHRLHNPPVEVTLTLLVPYVAYLAADDLATSGVLAVAAAGLVLSRHDPAVRSTASRLEAGVFWDMLVFLLNGLIFIVLGLSLRHILDGVADRPPLALGVEAIVIILTVALVRLLWMGVAVSLPLLVRRLLGSQSGYPRWKTAVILGWAGMRGADALVIALALPVATARGAPFPDRAVIIFLTFCVILATLVGQGLSLPALIRRLRLPADDTPERELALARAEADRAALTRLDELVGADGTPRELAEHLRRKHQHGVERQEARARGERNGEGEEQAARQFLRAVVEAEQRAIVALRNRGEIGDAALGEVLRDLDLEEQRLE